MNDKEKNNSVAETFQRLNFFGWFMIFLVSTSVIVIERLTPIYINNFYVRLFFYILSASLLVFWISWILFGFRAVRARIFIFAGVVIVCVAKAALTWGGDWKTQTILYKSTENNYQIEYQMRGDWFSFGYKDRIVERKKILPFFDCISDTDTTKLDAKKWKRIDKNVNQMAIFNFSGPPK